MSKPSLSQQLYCVNTRISDVRKQLRKYGSYSIKFCSFTLDELIKMRKEIYAELKRTGDEVS